MVVKRNPDQTREKILAAAFQEIFRNGFRSASVDRILADTGLTKGALYHHFPNKAALGHAVIDEIIGGYVMETWVAPLREDPDPVAALIRVLDNKPPEEIQQACEFGCPLNNLAQEMSQIDDTFRRKVAAIYSAWREGIAECLRRGQQQGSVRGDVDCEQAAAFFVASAEGAMGLAKNARDPHIMRTCMEGMKAYLSSLRPPSVPPSVPSS